MSYPRIIPCLLLDADGLVKTTSFGQRRYIGDPINTVRIYNEKEVDELVLFDINATAKNAEPRFSLIEKIAAECRMPVTYGGGIRTYADAARIISMGVEKISVSSQAFADIDLIRQIADSFGGQSTVACIDYMRNWTGKRQIMTHNAKRGVAGKIDNHVERFIEAGVGEIIFNSISDDGIMGGYDLSFAESVSERFDIPMTFLGGAGSPDHIQALFQKCGNIGAGVGSLFVYKGRLKGILINYLEVDEKKRILQLK